jgi:hypothetical protein
MHNNAQQKPQISDIPLYSVDMFDHSVDENGVHDFFWPVLHSEITETATDFLHQSAALLKQAPDNDQTAQIYKLAMKYFVAQFGGILQASLVKKRFEDAGMKPVAPDEWLIYPYVFADTAPPMPAFIQKLKNPKIKQSLIKRLSRPARILKILKKMSLKPQTLSIDGLKLKPLTNDVLKNAIIATQRTPLIVEHAACVTQDVVFSNTQRWFKNITDDEMVIHDKARHHKTEGALLKICDTLFTAHNLMIPPYLHTHLQDYLGALFAALRIHYTRLLQMDSLPRTVWTGTGGNIWDLILRLAVKQADGHVTGHDHGGGSGHVNVPIVGYIELWACDEFVTFNKKQAELYNEAQKYWPILDKMPPIVSGIKRETKALTDLDAHKKTKNKPIKTILLLATLYDRDRGRGAAFYPDIIYTDWQARLIAHLQKSGYKVLFKPHPESQITPHKGVRDMGDIEIINGLFSDIKQPVDLILFDFTRTTVFLEALKTDTPIVLIDFDSLPWHDNAKELCAKRCGFVEGHFDENNRVCVDWDKVDAAIGDAPAKRYNRELLETFYD